MKKIIMLIITLVVSTFFFGVYAHDNQVSYSKQFQSLTKIEAAPGEIINIPLINGLEQYKIKSDSNWNIEYIFENGEDIIKNIYINKDFSDAPSIDIVFVSEYISTRDTDFLLHFFITYDDKIVAGTNFEVSGVFANTTLLADPNIQYIDISDGNVAYCTEYIKEIEVDIGGVSLFTTLYPDYKYYGTVSRDLLENDYVIMDEYPEISEVYNINTLNLRKDEDKYIKFNIEDVIYYVYDKDLKWLGNTSMFLPYSSKYYLANVKIGD